MTVRATALLVLLALSPGNSTADINRRTESQLYSIHVDTASLMDLGELGQHLERARLLFHMSQQASDVACCMELAAYDLELFGTPGDGGDIIDSESKWNRLGNRKAFVTDISWPSPAAGKAQLGGQRMAVALDTSTSFRPVLIAHERGHNAGLSHRDDDLCNIMSGAGLSTADGGCLNVVECDAFRDLGSNDGTCDCMGPSVGDPPLPDAMVCSADGEIGYCKTGLCAEGVVFPHQKISHTEGEFTGLGAFNLALASLGDLDGDGVGDLAARGPTGPGPDPTQRDQGIWMLFLKADGKVKSHQRISPLHGGFDATLGGLGATITALGDLDGDGVTELANGSNRDDEGRGAATILFLNIDGTVRDQQRIGRTHGGFTGLLSEGDDFAIELAFLGDHNGDGVRDMAAGARGDDDGGTDRGAVWILFLYTDGTVRSHQKISDTQGGFTGILGDSDLFGESVASLGDLDGDGVGDMAVSAVWDDDGGTDRGAVWVLFLYADGTVRSHQKISSTQGGFTGPLTNFDHFGGSLSSLGDLDGDGVVDLAVGASGDDDGGANRGAVWILYLNADGTVKSHQKISSTQGGFTGTLDDDDRFGTSVASLGDLSRKGGVGVLAVNAWGDDDVAFGSGAVWILFLPEPDPTLLFVSAVGSLMLLHRVRRPSVR